LNNDPDKLRQITRAQLSLRNGQDKPEIWIAYRGLVYDYEHWAGQDLTDELDDAPHTEIVFERLQIIGRLT
jgi:predicted heme/steroid binding protein